MIDLAFLVAATIALWMVTFAVIVAVIVGQPSPIRVTRYSLIVLYAVVLHYIWAVALLVDPSAGHATSIAGLYQVFGAVGLPSLLICVATLALVYILCFSDRLSWMVLLALPQQAILFFSAATAISAMMAGHYADGVERAHAFIIADQAPAVLAAMLHSVALIAGFWRNGAWRGQPIVKMA